MADGMLGHSHADLRVPLPGGGDIFVSGQFPVTQSDWDFFLTVLDAMKPGLVAAAPALALPVPEGEQPHA